MNRYLVFEDRVAGGGASVVVTCALVSRMKADLAEDQFKLMVTELAKAFGGAPSIRAPSRISRTSARPGGHLPPVARPALLR